VGPAFWDVFKDVTPLAEALKVVGCIVEGITVFVMNKAPSRFAGTRTIS